MSLIKFLNDLPAHQVAFATIFIIVLAFILKERKAKANSDPSDSWTARQYFMYLNSIIGTCRTLDQLNDVRPLVDNYLARYFGSISNDEMNKYYTRLMNAIREKENELTGTLLKAM
jgi:hypothetical protein